MAHRYLLFSALLVGYALPSGAQQLPANVRARPHGWYLSPSVTMLQTQLFESTTSILQSAANDPQPALGIRLGYSYSPDLALETGFHVLPNNSGFRATTEQYYTSLTYVSSQLYLPLALVLRVWQPTPRLAAYAVVGGGLYLQNQFGSFTDTLKYASVSGGSPDGKLLLRQQGTSRARQYGAELGLRAEWQASSKVYLGFEAKDFLALSAPADNALSVTDDATQAVLAAARMAVRRHTLAAGVTVRCILQMGTSYRYQPER